VDRVVVTNSCGRLIRSSGTLQYSQLVLDPNLCANGDGIPNGWKQLYGLDPFLWNVGDLDPDHDGMSNLQEYLAGTNPTNANSVVRILSLQKSGSDIGIVWQAAGPRMIQLQAAGAGGAFTSCFQDIGRATRLLSPGDYQRTNWDIGGAAQPGRYYRLQVLP